MGYSNVTGIHQLPSSCTRINRRLHHLLRTFVICYHRAINRVLGLGSDAELVLGMFAPPNESFFFVSCWSVSVSDGLRSQQQITTAIPSTCHWKSAWKILLLSLRP